MFINGSYSTDLHFQCSPQLHTGAQGQQVPKKAVCLWTYCMTVRYKKKQLKQNEQNPSWVNFVDESYLAMVVCCKQDQLPNRLQKVIMNTIHPQWALYRITCSVVMTSHSKYSLTSKAIVLWWFKRCAARQHSRTCTKGGDEIYSWLGTRITSYIK